MPKGPGCGHECVGSCQVRHVGPTSHLRDHHVRHAAKSVSHTWMAAIVTGVAIVLTGALALGDVQASDANKDTEYANQSLAEEVRRLSHRVEDMESALLEYANSCSLETADNSLGE